MCFWKGRIIMTIEKQMDGKTLTVKLEGRLDTTTAPRLEAVVDGTADDVEALIFDLAELEYVSSAGLRVFLKAQKRMSAHGSMKLIHVNETIMEVFDITGFVDILTIE